MKYTVRVEGILIVEGKDERDAEQQLKTLLRDKAPWLSVSPVSARLVADANAATINRIQQIGES